MTDAEIAWILLLILAISFLVVGFATDLDRCPSCELFKSIAIFLGFVLLLFALFPGILYITSPHLNRDC